MFLGDGECCFYDDDAAVGYQCFNCKKRRKAKVNAPRGEELTGIRAGHKGTRRKASWNSFVLPSTLAERSSVVPAWTYSVCGTRCGNRILAVMNGEHSMCSRDECKGYPKKALLVELLKDLREDFISRTGGSEECSKFFLGRGSSATSGVEGFYTPDGIHLAHTFPWWAEGPKYVVYMVSRFLVPPIVLITDTPCMVRLIMKKRCGYLLENGGALPRVGPGDEGSTTVDRGRRGYGYRAERCAVSPTQTSQTFDPCTGANGFAHPSNHGLRTYG